MSTLALHDAARAAAAVAPLLPPALVPIFDAAFARSHVLFDEFVHRLALQVVAAARLDLSAWSHAADVVTRHGLDPRCATVPVDWMLRHLAARGAIAQRDDAAGRWFRVERDLPPADPAPLLAEQRAHDPGCVPAYTLAETVARDYPAFLLGERAGEEILFAPARLPLWTGYFSNTNALYAVNNGVGAVALEAWWPPGGATVLELGGGLGSATLAALERFAAAGRLGEVSAYRFTELVPAFLRRAQRALERFAGDGRLAFAPLDMNRSFTEQGVAAQSVSVVYAVNTLHVAHDLAFTLAEIRSVLAPGGQIVVSECIRPTPGHTLYPEFVFNLLETFRAPRLHAGYRPNGGFLTPEQWMAALQAAGFVDPRVLPDVARIRDVVATFYVAAIGASRPS